ncbi:MAG: hypothetical protein FWE37_00215 [Spirochaetaceae bacterium]|nr:hypothetical protein [Spirochaetaceae bacterium]
MQHYIAWLIFGALVAYPFYRAIKYFYLSRKHMREDGGYDMFWEGRDNRERFAQDPKLQRLQKGMIKWWLLVMASIPVTAIIVIILDILVF